MNAIRLKGVRAFSKPGNNEISGAIAVRLKGVRKGNLWRKEGREGIERKVTKEGKEGGREGERGCGSKILPQKKKKK